MSERAERLQAVLPSDPVLRSIADVEIPFEKIMHQ